MLDRGADGGVAELGTLGGETPALRRASHWLSTSYNCEETEGLTLCRPERVSRRRRLRALHQRHLRRDAFGAPPRARGPLARRAPARSAREDSKRIGSHVAGHGLSPARLLGACDRARRSVSPRYRRVANSGGRSTSTSVGAPRW